MLSRDETQPARDGDERQWRERLAVLESQVAFQAERLLERAEELRSAERRVANQSEALAQIQRDAANRIADRDEAAVVLAESAAATASELAAANARVRELERALDDARTRRAHEESQALAALGRDAAELRAALSTITSELDRSRARAATAIAEAADGKRRLEETQRLLSAVTASRAWRLADWLHRRGQGRRR